MDLIAAQQVRDAQTDARFGTAYRSYAARVPAFFPSPLKMPTKETRA